MRTRCLGQVLLPLAALPSVASAVPCSPNCGDAPFEVKSVPGRDSAASSNTARAATPSVSGNYEDPMHPGMKRKVSKSGKFVFVNGADEDGKKFKLDGSVEQLRQTRPSSPTYLLDHTSRHRSVARMVVGNAWASGRSRRAAVLIWVRPFDRPG